MKRNKKNKNNKIRMEKIIFNEAKYVILHFFFQIEELKMIVYSNIKKA
jgi:hypothetical protein